MSYNYQIAKTVLTDKEKDRLACLYLNRRPDGTVDWDKATTEFDCASISSMKAMTSSLLKKVENAGGKVGASASTPTPTPKKGRAKKRKTTSADEDDDEEPTPVVKKNGRKDKKEAEIPAGSAVADDATVKGEPANVGEEDTTTWF